MLLALITATPSPAPTAPTEVNDVPGFLDLVPLITGAGGALVVLLLFAYLFLNNKIVTTKSVETLREADNNRFNDMVAQRDRLVNSLEQANTTTAGATENAKQSLELLRDLANNPPPKAPVRRRTQ